MQDARSENGGPTGFQRAALAVVDGDLNALRRLLDADPELVRRRSGDGFDATLLHFVAANGVPDDLQRTPGNAREICHELLDRGSPADAVGGAYGGGPLATPLCLLVSSWHPFERGVQAGLIEELVSGGACVDGIDGRGGPLATALVFGYTGAAETLARLGARVDSVMVAAGLGDLDLVDSFFDADGSPRPDLRGTYTRVIAVDGHDGPGESVQEALHLAVTHGRLEVARLLVERGADPNGRTLGHHCELPLCQAIFVQEAAPARWLVERGADLDRVDGKRGEAARVMARRSASATIRALA